MLYPEKAVSSSNSVQAKFMIQVRDYILYRFTQSIYLDRNQLTSITKLPED